MPKLRTDYVKTVKLEGLGEFSLREVEDGEREEYNVAWRKAREDAGLPANDQGEKEWQQAYSALSSETQKTYTNALRDAQDALLFRAITDWDGSDQLPVTAENVAALPTVTRIYLLREVVEMSQGGEAAKDFFDAFLPSRKEPPLTPGSRPIPPRPPS